MTVSTRARRRCHSTPRNEGLTNLRVAAIAIDPTAPSTVYAGTDDGRRPHDDGGTTSTAFSTGLSGADVDAIVVNPAGAAISSTAPASTRRTTSLDSDREHPMGRRALSSAPEPGTLLVGYGQLPFTAGGVAFSNLSIVPPTFAPTGRRARR